MPLAPGAVVTHALRLVRHLDGGGMGQVWIAEHLTLRTKVAVKFMAPSVSDVRGAAERFAREATAAAQIRSPNVVQVFDHGVTPEGMPYIVMELLDGEDLARRLARLGALDPVSTAIIVRQVGRALDKAHALGIVHRDVKPGNVFLVDAGGDLLAKVLDFGIAKQADVRAMTSTGIVVGSPAYMSPEQILDPRGVDWRCDLWALAVVSYECLTGKTPFHGETLGALSIAIERARFTPPTAVRPDLPPGLDAWFQRALHRDPKRRYASAREMCTALAMATGISFADAPAALEVGAARDALTEVASPSPPTLGGTSVSTKSRSSSRLALVALGAALSFGSLTAATLLLAKRLPLPLGALGATASVEAPLAPAAAPAPGPSDAPADAPPGLQPPEGPAPARDASADAGAPEPPPGASATSSSAPPQSPRTRPPRRRNRGF